MTEGGLLQWKRQTIDQHRGPATSYRSVHRPLPNPPEGMVWMRNDDNREWSLVSGTVSSGTLAEASFVNDAGNGDPLSASAAAATVEAVVVDDLDEKVYLSKERNFIEHHTDDTDTFQGICLRYKVTATQLRRANCFFGTNLNLAPNPLKIPINDRNRGMTGKAKAAPTGITKDQAVRRLVSQSGRISGMEARAYLEMHDWDFQSALQQARDDIRFEDHIRRDEMNARRPRVTNKASPYDRCFF